VSAIPRIHWRFTAEGGAGLPSSDAIGPWLSAGEQERLSTFRVDKRRRDWLLGRLNAKALLVAMIETATGARVEPADIEIARYPSGAPLPRLSVGATSHGGLVPGAPLPVAVSNTHSSGHALFAAAWTGPTTPPGFAIGVDLEWVEPRSPGFIHDFLTPAEQRYCAEADGAARDLRANLVWSAKESVLKALQRGLTADTYWLTCLPAAHAAEAEPDLQGVGPVLTGRALEPADASWEPLVVGALDPRLGADELAFSGLWREVEGFVATLAVGVRRGARGSGP
jgi:4'-phosphopantetheinyl transferase